MRGSALHWAVPAAALACLGCSPGDRGMLQPVAADGVTLVSTHGLPDDTARLTGGGVVADVTGSWAGTGPSVEIVYRTGTAPATFAVAPKLTWKGIVTPASHAWDRTLPVPGNTLGRPLLDSGALSLEPGERRTVVVEFAMQAAPGVPTLEDDVMVAVPMPDRARPVRFRLAPE